MTGPNIRYCVEALRFRWIDEENEIGELYWDLVHVAATYRTAEERADELFVELDRDVRVVSKQSRRKVGDVRPGTSRPRPRRIRRPVDRLLAEPLR